MNETALNPEAKGKGVGEGDSAISCQDTEAWHLPVTNTSFTCATINSGRTLLRSQTQILDLKCTGSFGCWSSKVFGSHSKLWQQLPHQLKFMLHVLPRVAACFRYRAFGTKIAFSSSSRQAELPQLCFIPATATSKITHYSP